MFKKKLQNKTKNYSEFKISIKVKYLNYKNAQKSFKHFSVCH